MMAYFANGAAANAVGNGHEDPTRAAILISNDPDTDPYDDQRYQQYLDLHRSLLSAPPSRASSLARGRSEIAGPGDR